MPVYITSVIVQENSASSVISAGREAIKIAEEWGCKVIALMGDNAPSMQLGLRELAKEKGGLLVLQDIFKLPVCAKTLKGLHGAISANQIPRYEVLVLMKYLKNRLLSLTLI